MLALLAKVQIFDLLFDKIIGAGDYFALTDIVTLYEVKVKHKTLKWLNFPNNIILPVNTINYFSIIHLSNIIYTSQW